MVPPGFLIKLPAIRSAPCPTINQEKNKNTTLLQQKDESYITYHSWRFNAFNEFTIAIIHHDQAVRILHLQVCI
jgi:hypothetical protein